MPLNVNQPYRPWRPHCLCAAAIWEKATSEETPCEWAVRYLRKQWNVRMDRNREDVISKPTFNYAFPEDGCLLESSIAIITSFAHNFERLLSSKLMGTLPHIASSMNCMHIPCITPLLFFGIVFTRKCRWINAEVGRAFCVPFSPYLLNTAR